MYVILALAVLLAAVLLFLLTVATRARLAVREGRRRRDMAARLAAVAVQVDETTRQERAVQESGAALTTLLPAIQPAKEGPRHAA